MARIPRTACVACAFAALAIALVVFTFSAVRASAAAPDEVQSGAAAPVVVMKTSLGEIRIELDREKAPASAENFLVYVGQKHYDGTIFHRVIDGFMIQGGGFTADMVKKPTGPPVKNEAQNGLKNLRGSVAMARTTDPDSATSQFFINVADNPGLDYPKPDGHGYAVFGRVTAGMDVVDTIKGVATGVKGGMRDVPVVPVVIESVRLAGGA
jgi:peptidyl-prolyl cis-trans isomerase A (cyclophilin A)